MACRKLRCQDVHQRLLLPDGTGRSLKVSKSWKSKILYKRYDVHEGFLPPRALVAVVAVVAVVARWTLSSLW